MQKSHIRSKGVFLKVKLKFFYLGLTMSNAKEEVVRYKYNLLPPLTKTKPKFQES